MFNNPMLRSETYIQNRSVLLCKSLWLLTPEIRGLPHILAKCELFTLHAYPSIFSHFPPLVLNSERSRPFHHVLSCSAKIDPQGGKFEKYCNIAGVEYIYPPLYCFPPSSSTHLAPTEKIRKAFKKDTINSPRSPIHLRGNPDTNCESLNSSPVALFSPKPSPATPIMSIFNVISVISAGIGFVGFMQNNIPKEKPGATDSSVRIAVALNGDKGVPGALRHAAGYSPLIQAFSRSSFPSNPFLICVTF